MSREPRSPSSRHVNAGILAVGLLLGVLLVVGAAAAVSSVTWNKNPAVYKGGESASLTATSTRTCTDFNGVHTGDAVVRNSGGAIVQQSWNVPMAVSFPSSGTYTGIARYPTGSTCSTMVDDSPTLAACYDNVTPYGDVDLSSATPTPITVGNTIFVRGTTLSNVYFWAADSTPNCTGFWGAQAMQTSYCGTDSCEGYTTDTSGYKTATKPASGNSRGISIQIRDSAGNQGYASEWVWFDDAKPQLNAPTVNGGAVQSKYRGTVPVHLSATDWSGSGVKMIWYKLDGYGWTGVSGSSHTVYVSGWAYHRIDWYAVDHVDHQSDTGVVQFAIDDGVPTSSPISVSSGTPASLPDWYTSSEVRLTASYQDPGAPSLPTSNLVFARYGVSTSASSVSPNLDYSSVIVVNGEGHHVVSTCAQDEVGNSNCGSYPTRAVNIDSRKPVVTVTPSGQQGNVVDGNLYYRGPVDVTLVAQDPAPGTGLTGFTYTLWPDGPTSPTNVPSGAIRISAEGVHYLNYTATDAAGWTTTGSAKVVIDSVPPVSSASVTCTNGRNGWCTAPDAATLSISVFDSGSGKGSTTYLRDGQGPNPYSGAISIGTDGVHRFEYWSSDRAGNEETAHKFVNISLDRTAPSLWLNSTPTAPNGDNGWYRGGSVSVSAACSDATSGCDTLETNLNNTGWSFYYSNPYSFTKSGNYTVASRATDRSSHAYVYQNRTFNIDLETPSVVITPAGPQGGGGWYTGTVTLNAEVYDSMSGKGTLSYGTSSTGPWTAYNPTSPPTVTAHGQHTRWFRGTDRAGNAHVESVTVKLDLNAPVAAIGAPSGTLGDGGWYVSSVTATVNANDNASGTESGAASVQYRRSPPDLNFINASLGATVTLSQQGTNLLEARGIDVAGNTGAVASTSVKIDTVKPTHATAFSPAIQANGWIRGCGNVTFTASDATSLVRGTYWTLDGTSSPTTGNPAPPAQHCGTGAHQLVSWTYDNAGNRGLNQYHNYSVDAVPPACRQEVVPATPDGSNGWWRNAVTGRAIASDNAGGSGVSGLWYRIRANNVTVVDWTATASGANFSVSREGVFRIECYAKDVAGWESPIAGVDVAVDTGNPSTTHAFSPAPNAKGWITACANVTLTPSDAVSGPWFTDYKLDNAASWSRYTAPVMVCGDGAHPFAYLTTDKAGRAEATKSTTVQVDRNAPKTTNATPSGILGNNGYYRSNVTVDVSCSDGTGSGCALIQYNLDSTGWQNATGIPASIRVEGDKTHTLAYRGVDAAGLVEAEKSINVAIDANAPTASWTLTPSEPQPTGWYRGDVTVAVSTSDPTVSSGILYVECLVDAVKQTWESSSVTFKFTTDGQHSVTCRAEDRAGNKPTAYPGNSQLSLDKTAPSSWANVTGTQMPSGWWSSASVVFECSDATSQCAGMEWRDNGGAWRSFTGTRSTVVLGEGWHNVTYRATDVAGNVQADQSLATVRVDGTAPVSRLRVGEPIVTVGSTSYVSPGTPFSFTYEADASGPKVTKYRVNGGPTQTYSGQFTLSGASGQRTIAWWTEDHAGHVETERTAVYHLDSDGPVTSIVRPPRSSIMIDDVLVGTAPIRIEAGSAAVVEPRNVPGVDLGGVVVIVIGGNVVASATDVTGVDRYEFYVDGVLQQGTSSNVFPFDATGYSPGAHNITVVAYDSLGNSDFDGIDVDIVAGPVSPLTAGHADYGQSNLRDLINGGQQCVPLQWKLLPDQDSVTQQIVTCIHDVIQGLPGYDGGTSSTATTDETQATATREEDAA